MHSGRIDTQSAASRVFAFLVEHSPQWVDAWELTIGCHTTSLSTRIAEIREQLRGSTEWQVESKCNSETKKWYYRVVPVSNEPGLF